MALESVDYSEEKACKILEIVMQDDKGTTAKGESEIKHEIKEDACVENDSTPAADAKANDAAPNEVTTKDERYVIVKHQN